MTIGPTARPARAAAAMQNGLESVPRSHVHHARERLKALAALPVVGTGQPLRSLRIGLTIHACGRLFRLDQLAAGSAPGQARTAVERSIQRHDIPRFSSLSHALIACAKPVTELASAPHRDPLAARDRTSAADR